MLRMTVATLDLLLKEMGFQRASPLTGSRARAPCLATVKSNRRFSVYCCVSPYAIAAHTYPLSSGRRADPQEVVGVGRSGHHPLSAGLSTGAEGIGMPLVRHRMAALLIKNCNP